MCCWWMCLVCLLVCEMIVQFVAVILIVVFGDVDVSVLLNLPWILFSFFFWSCYKLYYLVLLYYMTNMYCLLLLFFLFLFLFFFWSLLWISVNYNFMHYLYNIYYSCIAAHSWIVIKWSLVRLLKHCLLCCCMVLTLTVWNTQFSGFVSISYLLLISHLFVTY